jgi:hypothetical protein
VTAPAFASEASTVPVIVLVTEPISNRPSSGQLSLSQTAYPSASAADADGRLPLSRMTAWDVFPFEQAGLRVVPLAPPVLPEPPRGGEDGLDCPACADGRAFIWSDERWRLSAFESSGAPLILMLEPAAHVDLPGLPDELADAHGGQAHAIDGPPPAG